MSYDTNTFYHTSNKIYRAMDMFSFPETVPIIKVVQSIRVLLEHQSFRSYYRKIPTPEQLFERLDTLYNTCSEQQCVREIRDVYMSHNRRFPERPVQRYNVPRPPTKTVLESIQNDSENVHFTPINRTVKSIAHNLCTDFPQLYSKDHILHTLSTKDGWNDTIIRNTIEFIWTNDTSFGLGISLRKLLCAVVSYIRTFEEDTRTELFIRLNQELVDMSGLCSTGHMSRLVNTLQGFNLPEKYVLTIDIERDIRDRIGSELRIHLEKADDHIVEGILDQTPEFVKYIDDYVERHTSKWITRWGEESRGTIRTTVDKFVKGK